MIHNNRVLENKYINDIIFKNYYINKRNIKKKKNIKCGTIILNKNRDSIILVQNKYLLKEKNIELWGIPKGSRNENETYADCAMRETYEETGMLLKLRNNMLRIKIENTYYFVFIIDKPTNILVTNDKIEIHKVKWFKLKDININKINYETKLCIKRKLNIIKRYN